MKTVTSRTTMSPIGKDKVIKPQGVFWVVENDGETTLFINSLRVKPGQRFGIDNLPAAPPGTEFKNDTEFFVKFIPGTITETLHGFPVERDLLQSATLIETNYTIQ